MANDDFGTLGPQLLSIETSLATILARQAEREKLVNRLSTEINVRLDRIETNIRGNGQPGLMTRIDRIEQKDEMRGRHFWVIWPILLSTAAAAVWQWVQG